MQYYTKIYFKSSRYDRLGDLFLSPHRQEHHTFRAAGAKCHSANPPKGDSRKRPIFSFARARKRAHVWQLHVDILPAAESEPHGTGGRKVEAAQGTSRMVFRVRVWTSYPVSWRLRLVFLA